MSASSWTPRPDGPGATLQLAKPLDRAGKSDEATVLWKKMLEMAEPGQDEGTAATARACIAGRQ